MSSTPKISVRAVSVSELRIVALRSPANVKWTSRGSAACKAGSAALPAKVIDHFGSPRTHLFNTSTDLSLSVVGGVDKRAGLLDTDALIDSAYDPYVFFRNPRLQRSEYQVRDGKVPPDGEIKEDTDPSTPNMQFNR